MLCMKNEPVDPVSTQHKRETNKKNARMLNNKSLLNTDKRLHPWQKFNFSLIGITHNIAVKTYGREVSVDCSHPTSMILASIIHCTMTA